MKEIWKDVPGFARYQVSNEGRVRSCHPSKIGHNTDYKLLTPQITKLGYLQVGIGVRPAKRKMFFIHRLVYAAFVGVVPENYCLDHADRNPLNNCLENIRCTTRSMNAVNQKKRVGRQYKGVRLTRDGKWEARSSFNKKTVYLGRYDTAKQAAKVYNDYALKAFGEFAVLNVLPEEIQ